MSYCELIEFREGKPADSLECRNAWGGMAFIFSALFDVYCKDPNIQYDTWLTKPDRVWKLANKPEIPVHLRAVLCSTFDYAVVYRADFKRYAADLRTFAAWAGTRNTVCHLLTWADFVEKSDAEAIGHYATSVGDNLWHTHDDETDSTIPYDLTTGTKHFDVYAEFSAAKGG